MAALAGTLSIEHWSGASEHVLVLRGTIDDTGAERLARAVDELCLESARVVELDLGRLDCIDHRGIGAVLTAKRICAEHRAEFRLVPPMAAMHLAPQRPHRLS